jgi:hypothetical protein
MCSHDDLLPESTRKLWRTLQNEQFSSLLSGFTLVGGTALTLRIGHRISHDLDFMWAHPAENGMGTKPLPSSKIAQFIHAISATYPCEKTVNIAAEQDFLNDGMDLDDFQQDFMIGGVNVTFFKASDAALRVINEHPPEMASESHFGIATTDAIFLLKCLVVLERQKSRDYFDLYTLANDFNYNPNQARPIMDACNGPYAWDAFSARLSSLLVNRTDEGYVSCIRDASKQVSVEGMRVFFSVWLQDSDTHESIITPDQAKTILDTISSLSILQLAHSKAAEKPGITKVFQYTAEKRASDLVQSANEVENLKSGNDPKTVFGALGKKLGNILDQHGVQQMDEGGLSMPDLAHHVRHIADAAKSFGQDITQHVGAFLKQADNAEQDARETREDTTRSMRPD